MDIYEKMFRDFKISAYRVETLPVYHIEGGEWEEFEQYRNGIPIEGFANQDWINELTIWKNSNKEIKRFRVIPPMLNEYLCYEFEWCYPRNWIAGEIIKVVDQKTYEKLIIPETEGDFWMFDEKYVLKMEYDIKGYYIGERIISEQDAVSKYSESLSRLEQKSVLYTDVMKKIRKAKLSVLLD